MEKISLDSLSAVLTILNNNTRLSSAKTLGKVCGISPEAMNEIIIALQNISYVRIVTFPKGNFKTFRFNRYGEGIMYCDGFAVIENGRHVAGSFSRMANPLSRREKEYYRDRSVEYGLISVTEYDFLKVLSKQLHGILNAEHLEQLAKETNQAKLAEKYKVFDGYPLALKLYQQQEFEIQKAKADTARLEAADAQTQKQYEHELYLAKSGQRVKKEPYSVQVGTEEIGYSDYLVDRQNSCCIATWFQTIG